MTALTVTNKDRLSFSLFLAAALHAALILGVGFSSELNMPNTPSIEVTLSVTNDPDAPEEADFLAATNQIGSGTEEEVNEMITAHQKEVRSCFTEQNQKMLE